MATAFALPPLRDLLFSMEEDELWAVPEVDLLPPPRGEPYGAGLQRLRLMDAPEPARGGGGGGGGGGPAAAQHSASTAALIASHPLWPPLVDAYFACIKATAFDSASVRALNAERRELAEFVRTVGAASGATLPYVTGSDPELDAFMQAYIRELEVLKEDVEAFVTSTEKVFSDFERRINEILPHGGGGGGGDGEPAPRQRGAHNGHSPAPGTAMAAAAAAQAETGSLIFAATGSATMGGLLGREEEEQLRQHLKRKHAASILSLKEEFMRARKKGKLPKDATSALKTWWSANLVWPYPTDDDKRILGDETGLHPTQINNWFINQRKRHWHKLFPNGPPTTAEEAEEGLRAAYGSLEAALRVAEKA